MYMSVAPVQNGVLLDGVLLVSGASLAHCHKHVLSMSAQVPAQNTKLETNMGEPSFAHFHEFMVADHYFLC